MSDQKHDVPEKVESPRWARLGIYAVLMMIALWTSSWATKQLVWLFGWTAEPVEGHQGRILDALVILSAGLFVMFHALRLLLRRDVERQAMLRRLHDKAAGAAGPRHKHA